MSTYNTNYNTNLASEFHVLSILHRLGVDAYLTLGNKKSVDIVAVGENRIPIDIEVKGVAGNHDWTVGMLSSQKKEPAFVVLVSFDNKIGNPSHLPTCWVIPYSTAASMVVEYRTKNGTRYNIKRSSLKDSPYLGNWEAIATAARQGAAAEAQPATRSCRR